MVTVSPAVGADWIASSAAFLIASEVRVAPLTESQLLIVSSVADCPTITVFIPFKFFLSASYAFLKYESLSLSYPSPGVTTTSENFPSFTIKLTSTSYSFHSSPFSSSSAVLAT